MAMTLQELLALLPDNTTGDIGADDLRTIVTELFNAANTYAQTFSYQWLTSGVNPASGKVTTDVPWDMSATLLRINETTQDGHTLLFTLLEDSAGAQIWLSTAGGGMLKSTISGTIADQGSYRDIPVTVDSITGVPPANNEKTTVTVLAMVTT